MDILRTKIYTTKFLIFMLLVLSACHKQAQPKPKSVLTFTQTPSIEIITTTPESSLTGTVVPSPTPAMIQKPTLTRTTTPSSTRTLKKFPTLTATPTVTPTFLPSLEPSQAIEAIQKFRKEGWDCQTPCIFGIMPEKTTFYQAAAIFNWLHEPLSPWGESDPGFYQSAFYSNDLGLEVDLKEVSGFVWNVRLRISLVILYEGGTAYPHIQLWPAFSPDTLINKYGSPSEVEFRINSTHDLNALSSFNYDMYMYFAPLNLTIAYEGGIFPDDKSLKVCPLTDQFLSLEVWFDNNPDYLPKGVSLEKATSITLSQFSELMTQTSSSACFDLSNDAFSPTP